ncbi:hypothetical protein ACFFX0_02055 [Citricoccus parietis]|uniref:Uncharacterized protein n=1 Tax=Citricoccus parietis TaxID=592307 RepID=A0ABV5FTN1_9MICC
MARRQRRGIHEYWQGPQGAQRLPGGSDRCAPQRPGSDSGRRGRGHR